MGQNIGGQGIGPGPALPGPGSETVALPDAPVGEAPPPSEPPEQRVAAVPEGQGVLTRAGELFFEPSFEYPRSSTTRLVFRGIELIPGIQIGLVGGTDADCDTLVGTANPARKGGGSGKSVSVRVNLRGRRNI